MEDINEPDINESSSASPPSYWKNDLAIPNFGLSSVNANWKLMQFLDMDVISRLPLTDFQIDALADYLNWDILSSKELAGWIFVKYKDRIDWNTFLQNKKPKEINFLLDVKDKLHEYSHLFFDTRIKSLYYTNTFLSAMPEFVDWNWCAKNMKISDYILLRNWGKFNINKLSKYQVFSDAVIDAKKYVIKWQYACRNPLSEKAMRSIPYLLKWEVLCKHQKLSIEFIKDHLEYITKNKQSKYATARYQALSPSFILKHKWLDMEVVSQFQNLSIDFIRQNQKILSLEHLAINKWYNKPNTIQIFKTADMRWYIIDAPVIRLSPTSRDAIHYCNESIEIE